MGKTQSTQKTVESSGEVNNNVVINEPEHLNQQFQILLVGWIICAIKIIEFALFIYKRHQKQLKKKYANNPA